ncbi:MAG TPA: DUF5615 family PIN-like protein [Ktedonobacterales bacterium]
MDFRTKRELLRAGFAAVLQLADVGLAGLATDPEIFSEAQQRSLVLITKGTDFTRQARYALGHYGILRITQSKTELQDTVIATLALAAQYPSLVNVRVVVLPGGQFQVVP